MVTEVYQQQRGKFITVMFVVNRFTSELGITVANYIETSIVTAQVAVQYKTGRVLTDILIVIQLSLTRRVDSV